MGGALLPLASEVWFVAKGVAVSVSGETPARGADVERATVFGTVKTFVGCRRSPSFVLSRGMTGRGRPDINGGGSSKPSAALLDNWLAKSDACHHSRNFRANIEVGRRILKLENRRGITASPSVRGLKMLVDWPGLAGVAGAAGGG